jgi:hypothetical protein
MTLPNFVGIGAQRAATTWMHSCLKEHPQVFVPKEKELHFFNLHFQKGTAWYEEQFRSHTGEKAVGEITPNYLDSEVAIPRMAQIIPHARLFVILREPVQRAFSAYQLFQEKLYKGMSFREACEQSDYLIKLGLYAGQLERVFTYYDRSAVKVFLYDDIQNNPRAAITALFTFLQVDEHFKPLSLGKIYNRVMLPRAQKWLETARLGWAANLVKRTALGEWIKRQSVQNRSFGAEMTDKETTHHLKEIFRNDILKLQALINRDLSHWLA